jgi:hypothetical protein
MSYEKPIPSAADFLVRAPREPHWPLIPLELVLAASRSCFNQVIIDRYHKGAAPHPNCWVFANGGRLFAQVVYLGPERQSLVLPLNARLWDNRDTGKGGFTLNDLEPF